MAYGYRNTPTAVNDGGSREEPRPQSSYGSIWDRLLGNLTDKLNEAADVISDNTGTHFKPNADYQNWLNNFGTNRQNEEEPEQPAPQNNYEQPAPAPQQQKEEEEPAPTPQEPINEQPAPAPVSTPINTGRLGISLLAEPLVEPVTEDQGKKNPSPSDFLTPYRNQPKPLNPVLEKNDEAPLTNSIMYQDWQNLINSGAGSGAGSAEIPFSSGTPQQDVSVLGNGYVRPLPYANDIRNNITDPLLQFGRNVADSIFPTGFTGYNQPVNIGVSVEPNFAGALPRPTVEPNYAGTLPRPTVEPNFAGALPQLINEPVLSGNDPLAQYADLFEPQGGSQTPDISGGERMNPSISDFDEQQALDVLNSTTGRGPIDYSDVTANIGSKPFSFQDPQWLQDLTGGNSLAGVISDTAANALDSILRIGSGGPVTPQADIPLDRAGDYMLGQLIGSDNVAPAVEVGNTIVQNPAVRDVGDFFLDQQLGRRNADELRTRLGIDTTPSTIMNQPAPSTTGGTSQPTTTAPQTTGSGSSGKNFVEGLGDWISGLFGGNNAEGSNGTPRPGADAYLNSTQGGSTSGNTPQTGARMTPDEYANYLRDAVSDERYYDDLMQMAAPGVDANGNLNTAAQALLMGLDKSDPYSGRSGQLSTEQMLHLFDKGGAFADPASGVNINDAFRNLIADNPSYAVGNPDMAQLVDLTEEQYKEQFKEFLKANPLIQALAESGTLSADDIMNNFFKGRLNGNGTGSGSSKPDGSKTYQPSYEQGGQVVKAPYKKGGYSEDEIKKMGNKPYKDYRGNTAYEGYYYWNGRWYPVDQDKANYYNTFGTYDGYNDDMKRYYNTFGTYYGYRPGWRTAGRAVSSGGGGGYGGGGSYGGGSYSSSYSNSGYNNSSTPSTRNQDRNVDYNIMKNWAYND